MHARRTGPGARRASRGAGPAVWGAALVGVALLGATLLGGCATPPPSPRPTGLERPGLRITLESPDAARAQRPATALQDVPLKERLERFADNLLILPQMHIERDAPHPGPCRTVRDWGSDGIIEQLVVTHYDGAGRRVRDELYEHQSRIAARVRAFAYDDDGRLVEQVRRYPDKTEVRRYAYDEDGNRVLEQAFEAPAEPELDLPELDEGPGDDSDADEALVLLSSVAYVWEEGLLRHRLEDLDGDGVPDVVTTRSYDANDNVVREETIYGPAGFADMAGGSDGDAASDDDDAPEEDKATDDAPEDDIPDEDKATDEDDIPDEDKATDEDDEPDEPVAPGEDTAPDAAPRRELVLHGYIYDDARAVLVHVIDRGGDGVLDETHHYTRGEDGVLLRHLRHTAGEPHAVEETHERGPFGYLHRTVVWGEEGPMGSITYEYDADANLLREVGDDDGDGRPDYAIIHSYECWSDAR